MNILAIDQSYTSSGIVIFKDGLVHKFMLYKTPKEMDIFERAWNISEHIVALCNEYDVDFVAIEGLAFGIRGDATRDLAGLQFAIVGKVKFVCKTDITIVPPRTLKKFATTSGKVTKKEMIAALPADIRDSFTAEGYKLTTGLADLTDAYFLGKYVYSQQEL